MSDLEQLFSRLRAQQSASSPATQQLWADQNQPTHHHPHHHHQIPVSTPLISPPAHTPSSIQPPNTAAYDTNRTNHLLNLLTQPRRDPRPLSAADVMQNVQRSSSGSAVTRASLAAVSGDELRSKSTGNPQDFLLNLLTKGSKPATPAVESDMLLNKGPKPQPDVDDLAKQFGQSSVNSTASHHSSFAPPSGNKASMFNYINPFDQLHSSAPTNRTRTPQPNDQPATTPGATTPAKIEILKHERSVSSNSNNHNGDASRKMRKVDPNTSSAETTSVSRKLEGVGEAVEKQVEQALKAADSKEPLKKPTTPEVDTIKKETVNNEDVESSWESAEDDAKDYNVEVYNFPMKPFVSIQIKSPPTVRPIRQDNFMVIAQLKKEFDQIDRSLVTASQTHIVYAQVATKKDNGGFRIIRQDSGDHKQVFRSSGERVFNVQICGSSESANDMEAVLGTGVNGSVFWTSLSKSGGERFLDDDIESLGFILPAVATAEENNSGSPVKTRVRLSSRHPDFFAIARGKQIFVIAHQTVTNEAYCDVTTRKVNSEKFFAEQTLKINTGKAGKDFCFSEDDTVIASLDKNGRFKFWDVRELTAQACAVSQAPHDPVELREPLWQLTAAASGSRADDKASVSSIMFLDKDRPVQKGSALRYVLIGFKQNHTIQLWDLGLGKAVQEVCLPHEKDSDGICSITYHPKTGVVAIGHPTRNSIYFLHVSAPKYNLPHMEQARYISMLATHDSTLPKPESTAIMSGLREFSFAKVGQLRSIDMLRTPVENASEKGTADETLFELYVMHSKGVIGISIKRDDLGWDAQSKMTNPKDALKEGVVEVRELSLPSRHTQSASIDRTSNADSSSKPTSRSVSSKRPEPAKAPTPQPIKRETMQSPTPQSTNIPRMGSPAPPTKPLPKIPTNPPLMTADSYSLAGQRTLSSTSIRSTDDAGQRNVVMSPKAAQAAHASVQATAPFAESADYHSIISKQFDSLYQRLESDKRVQDAAGAAKQDALLRLVSSTLTENVDRSLSSIIATRIEKDVIPTLTEVTSRVVDSKIAESLPPQLNASVSAAMKANLSNTLQQALKDKEVHKAISEATANHVAQRVQQQISALLQQQLPEMTHQAAQRINKDLENKFLQHQRQYEDQRQQDTAKIEELSGIVRSLSTTLQGMATSQSAFQDQILKMQREARTLPEGSTRSNASSAAATRESPPAPEDEDVVKMTQLLVEGKYEEATIQWISSDRQAEIYDKLFVRVNPTYLEHLSPLVALTVSAAITSSFDTFVTERLDWLSRVLQQIDVRNEEILDVAPKIMDVLSQRLQGAYMAISEERPSDPALKTIIALNKQVNEIRRVAQ